MGVDRLVPAARSPIAPRGPAAESPTMELIQAIAQVVGDIAIVCTLLSHVPFLPAKWSEALAHIGVNLVGAVKSVKK